MADDCPSIDQQLAAVRRRIPRLDPRAAWAAQRAGAVIVDTRDGIDRIAEGTIPGAVVITRNTLEWRVDATAEVPHPLLSDPAHDLIVMCNDGYSSGFAVESLHRIGRRNVSDLVGGFRAWRAAGLPTVPRAGPDGNVGLRSHGALSDDELVTLARLVGRFAAHEFDRSAPFRRPFPTNGNEPDDRDAARSSP